MANGSRAFAIPSGDAPEHTAPEKLTVLVVEPMKEPYVKEIDPGLHALQAEVGGDIAASYPFDDPVGLVLNDEGKLIGLDLNRSLRDEHGEIYDIVAGTFLVVGTGAREFRVPAPGHDPEVTPSNSSGQSCSPASTGRSYPFPWSQKTRCARQK